MDILHVDDRVIAKANPSFHGVVTRIAYEGAGGFVHFDDDEEPGQETYFSAGELDPEPAPEP
jgi:hypothetical protein